MARADSGTGPGAGPEWRWEVALSFAAAQREYVEQVARALRAQGVRCFYDADEQIELWGRYLAEELPAVYGEQAAAVVVFVSAEYAARDWTRLERRAALNRAVRERREYVLPARFDDTQLPGLLSDMVAVDLRGRSPEQFAAMVAAKLDSLGITAPGPAGSPPSPPVGGSDAAAAVGGEQSSSTPGSPPSPPGSGSDADAKQSSPWHGWSERHGIIVGIWVAFAGALLGAIAYGLIQLLQPNDSAVTEANQVAACVSEHHLTGISEGPSKVPSGIIVPFVRENFGTFLSQNPVYGRAGSLVPIPVALFASCSWPPSPGADITGYSQILVSTVPGNTGGAFKGLANPYDYADVLDSSCRVVVIDYYFQHELRSGSMAVRVSRGGLYIMDFDTAVYPAPGPHGKKPNTVSSWAQTVGYYTASGESVVLRSARAKLWKVTCAS